MDANESDAFLIHLIKVALEIRTISKDVSERARASWAERFDLKPPHRCLFYKCCP